MEPESKSEVTKRTRRPPYPAELRERSVRMVLDHRGEYANEQAAITSIASKMGMHPDTLKLWVHRAQVDGGGRAGMTTDERGRLKALERENRELKRANEILKSASIFFATELCATRRFGDRGVVRDLPRRAVAAVR